MTISNIGNKLLSTIDEGICYGWRNISVVMESLNGTTADSKPVRNHWPMICRDGMPV